MSDLVSRCQQEREGYTLAVSHGRPGIAQQVSGVALPYPERKMNVDIKCQRQRVQHQNYLPTIHDCMYIPRTTAYYMYYKSIPLLHVLVFTPVADAIWLLCSSVRRAKRGPISSVIYLLKRQLLGASAAKVSFSVTRRTRL